MFSAAYLRQLLDVAEAAEAAGHGGKEAIYMEACTRLRVSRATLLKHLRSVCVTAPRKQRADAGSVSLGREEAVIISAYLMEGYRKNNRKITSLKTALEVLRANGEVLAGRVDAATGAIKFLSDGAIARALRVYSLHPEQLLQPTPHTNLRSLYPNHVWEVDASVCVLYYLPGTGAELVELDQAIHYKNKPENFQAIEKLRVIRYVLTDHASGVIRYRYYPHAESGEHTVRFLAWAIAEKPADPFHGAPRIVMVDPGATAGGLVRRFCVRMSIDLVVNQSKNARAKGSVEKANHIVETTFEQGLKYLKTRPDSFEALNILAEKFQIWFNTYRIHTRTGKTRFSVWLTITPDQLRTTPGEDVLLTLATQEPISRIVSGDLTVSFKSRTWDVGSVPGVLVGGKVLVHWHPFIADTAMAVVTEDGRERHIALRERVRNELGFFADAAVIGEAYAARADTMANSQRKAVMRTAAVSSTTEEAEKKRASKRYIPFDGRIDPFAESHHTPPAFLPRRGVALDVGAPKVELLTLTTVQTAKWLAGHLGDAYQPDMLVQVQTRFPGGATEADLEGVLEDLARGHSEAGRGLLRAV